MKANTIDFPCAYFATMSLCLNYHAWKGCSIGSKYLSGLDYQSQKMFMMQKMFIQTLLRVNPNPRGIENLSEMDFYKILRVVL